MRYRPEIDGLRAIAVIPVILFHAGFQLFSGGFVGVDVFFVISGYLITTIILAELEAGRFSLLTFYERRIRRILPALYVVMASCLPFACLWLMPSDAKEFSSSAMAGLVFASNIFFWENSNYFDAGSELKPLLHTWSLGVEAQFYVLVPIFLMAAWRLGRKRIIGLLAIVTLLSFALAVYATSMKPVAAFFLLPTRGWELAMGSLIAFYLEEKKPSQFPPALHQILSFVGLGLIAVAALTFSKETPFPSVYTLAPTVGAGLIIVFGLPDTLVGRLLASRAFVGVGLVSYSAYLWHQPLLSFARHRSLTELDESVIAGIIVLTFSLAYVTWRYIEMPFRRGNIVPRRLLWRFSLASVVVLAVSMLGIQLGMSGTNSMLATEIKEQWRIHTCFFQKGETYETLLRNHCDVASGATPQANDDASHSSTRFVLYGDSVAAHLYPGLMRVLGEDKIIQLTAGSCSAIRVTRERRCADFYDWFVDDYVPNNKRDGIIVSSNWLPEYTRFGDEKFRVHLDALFEKLKGQRVIVYSQPSKLSVDIHRYVHKLKTFTGEVPHTLELKTQSLEAVNAALSEESAKFGFEFIDVTQLFCSRSQCGVVKDGVIYFWDTIHLTVPGSVLVAELTHGLLTGAHAEELPGASDQSTKDPTIFSGALMVRNFDGTIRYWSTEAKKLYGWEPSDALGTTSHQLLRTEFPVPLKVIEQELRAKGYWTGPLVHVLRDGSRVRVVSYWMTSKSRYSQDGSMKVIEINNPMNASSGSFRKELFSLLNEPKCLSSWPACPMVS